MRKNRNDLVIKEAKYFVDNSSTVRDTAKEFRVSKSTIYYDFIYVLPGLNRSLSVRTRFLLRQNKLDRHIRGGLATKLLYQKG